MNSGFDLFSLLVIMPLMAGTRTNQEWLQDLDKMDQQPIPGRWSILILRDVRRFWIDLRRGELAGDRVEHLLHIID